VVVMGLQRDALFDKKPSGQHGKKSFGRAMGKVILISDRAGLDAESEGTWGQIEMPPGCRCTSPRSFMPSLAQTAGLSYCHRQGEKNRCRPSTQPSQIGDRRMNPNPLYGRSSTYWLTPNCRDKLHSAHKGGSPLISGVTNPADQRSDQSRRPSWFVG